MPVPQLRDARPAGWVTYCSICVSTMPRLGCPLILLQSKTKRNGSENERCEIAKQKVSFARNFLHAKRNDPCEKYRKLVKTLAKNTENLYKIFLSESGWQTLYPIHSIGGMLPQPFTLFLCYNLILYSLCC